MEAADSELKRPPIGLRHWFVVFLLWSFAVSIWFTERCFLIWQIRAFPTNEVHQKQINLAEQIAARQQEANQLLAKVQMVSEAGSQPVLWSTPLRDRSWSHPNSLSFSADGRHLAVCTSDENQAFVFNSANGAKVRTIEPGTPIFSVAFLKSTNLLMVDEGLQTELWDIETGKLIATFTGNPHPATRDHSWINFNSSKSHSQTVAAELAQFTSENGLSQFNHERFSNTVSADGQHFLTFSSSNEILAKSDRHLLPSVVAKLVPALAGRDAIFVCDVKNPKAPWYLPIGKRREDRKPTDYPYGFFGSSALSQDGRRVAAHLQDFATISLADVDKHEVKTFENKGPVEWLAFDKTGNTLVVVSSVVDVAGAPQLPIRLLAVDSQKVIAETRQVGLGTQCQLVDDDRTLICQSEPGILSCWNLATGKLDRTVPLPFPVASYFVSANGKLIAIQVPGGFRFFDVAQNKLLSKQIASTKIMTLQAFSPLNDAIAGIVYDKTGPTLTVWSLRD